MMSAVAATTSAHAHVAATAVAGTTATRSALARCASSRSAVESSTDIDFGKNLAVKKDFVSRERRGRFAVRSLGCRRSGRGGIAAASRQPK
jgi:hypothetical protein